MNTVCVKMSCNKNFVIRITSFSPFSCNLMCKNRIDFQPFVKGLNCIVILHTVLLIPSPFGCDKFFHCSFWHTVDSRNQSRILIFSFVFLSTICNHISERCNVFNIFSLDKIQSCHWLVLLIIF